MGEREGDAVLKGDLDNDGPVVRDREEEFSLEGLDMLRVIGTGTFARVCLCQVSEKVRYFMRPDLYCLSGQRNQQLLCLENLDNVSSDKTETGRACDQ